ncbi:hypothetical protein P691DRAFT_759112 [Macrolepiota fuliginosa MF-IS2]|uniref:DUF6533 domain-containing protein n=1 Tax=Macrolepiota fuliginosa MF-IS2 TaxID=1400762 RepID=A0A9P6C532_9AGAR|nr:hypothetical protein P691DRAFT_759112 [Macrolepiota fuliginosa MF-IS2]
MSASNITTNEPLQMLQEVMVAIEGNRNIQNVAVASAAIMILEWFLTFEMEIALVWKTEWNAMKGIYIASRYLPFINVPIALIFGLNEGFSVEGCKVLYNCIIWMFGIGQAAADLVLMLRTWVVWGKTKHMGLFLAACYIVVWVVILIGLALQLWIVTYVPSPVPRLMGCIVQNTNVYMTMIYAAATIYYASMLVLILIPGISVWKFGAPACPSGLERVIYSDGVIFYVYIFVLSLLNLIIIVKLPKDYINLLMTCVDTLQLLRAPLIEA